MIKIYNLDLNNINKDELIKKNSSILSEALLSKDFLFVIEEKENILASASLSYFKESVIIENMTDNLSYNLIDGIFRTILNYFRDKYDEIYVKVNNLKFEEYITKNKNKKIELIDELKGIYILNINYFFSKSNC